MCSVDLREDEDITIGTVPLKELYENVFDQQQHSSTEESGSEAPLPSAVVDDQADQSHPVPLTGQKTLPNYIS